MTQATTEAPVKVGGFCWFDLNTRDVEGVKSFYNKLCGWTTSPSQAAGGDVYHHWHDRDGVMFGGIMDMNDPMWGDTPSHWMSYMRVDDADKSAAKATELGGTVCVPPTDIENVGRFSIISDPTGGTISLIHLDDPRPTAPVMAWNELLTRDAAKAKDFYVKLFGWGTEGMPMGGSVDYLVCKNGEEMIGGIMQMEGPQFENVPTHWLNYIITNDVDGDAAKIPGLGGSIVVPPMDIPNDIGRFCVFTDPGGGHIALYKSAQQG